jgi:two-component system, LuxR family, response regulator FixJ
MPKWLSQMPNRAPIVLVVDDDPAVRSSLKFSLELEGFTVRACGSAAELFRTEDLGSCDCFVIDQRMPNMMGIELIAKLRDRQILTPAILLVSTPPNVALSNRAADANVPIVEKPLLGNVLVDTIRQACRV